MESKTKKRSSESAHVPPRILLADDHQILRQGIRNILAEAWPKAHFLEVGNSQETIDAILKESWNIVLLDLNMPGRNGIDAIKAIKKVRPQTPILILTMHPEEQFGVRALKAGATGYLTKGCTSEELLKAVQTVMDGKLSVSPRLGEACVASLTPGTPQKKEASLSDREIEITTLLASGKGIKEIAADLFLSPKTVSSYRARVLEKLGIQSTAEMVRWAMQNGFLS